MKKFALYIVTALTVCFLFLFVGCKKIKSASDEVTLDKTAITLEIGESQTLTATANVETVQWSTSDAAIATVEDGTVTAVAAGSATITVKAGTASATCIVTVNEAPETVALTVDKTELALKEGGANGVVIAMLTVNGEATDCSFVWDSGDDAVATVENGNVTPVGVGNTVVTVSAEYKGETYTAEVNVVVSPDETIQVSKTELRLGLVESKGVVTSDTFTATAYKAGVEYTGAVITFESSDESVATVRVEGSVATVTSVGEGSCQISVSYTSVNGKVETFVDVVVSRTQIVLDETIEVSYVENNTVLDVSDLELAGTLESFYFGRKQIASEDGVLDANFVESNKGSVVVIEIRTLKAVYKTKILIKIPYKAEPKQGDSLAEMPTYDGDATTLGFTESTAYELTVGANAGTEGWSNRMVINVEKGKEVLLFDVVVKDGTVFDRFTMWPAENTFDTQGSYGVLAKSVDASVEADADRKIFVLDANNKRPSSLQTQTLYTVYFAFNEDETHVHFSMFNTGTLYVANIRCIDVEEIAYDPTLPPPPISQGESRSPMPTFEGDVTELGFTAGTTVYQVVGPQSNATDVKLVAQVNAAGDNAYAKMDIVFSAATTSFGLWITADGFHLGYYTVTPTSFTTDGNGNPDRNIFLTDANGERLQTQGFETNKKYTLYIGLDGREVTVQVSTWAKLTMYVANFACITETEAPVVPVPPVQGQEISILFIGNSFSDDTEAYMVDILLNLGYTDINIGNLYIGGCSINTHYQNIQSGASAYDFRMKRHNGKKYTEYAPTSVDGKKQSIAFALAYADWDIISVQQASGESGKASTYDKLDALVEEVKKKATNKDVEIVFNMTWAYQGNSTHTQFPDYNSDQMTMYNAIVNAVDTKVKYTVVPNATSIQNARTSFIGDNLTRDGYHLNLKIGRFIAGLTFVAKVTGADIADFAYAPNGVTNEQLIVAIESVQNAIKTPFEVTQSQYADESSTTPDVTAGGSNAIAVSKYRGDVTALGFAEGTIVYEYVGVDSGTDKAAIKVDSANYDYVEVQFVIAKGDGYFFMHGRKGGNYHNGGASYVIDPSWIRIADGSNSPSDRVIEIFDANGTKVTSLMKTNVVYTLRVYVKVGALDEILISKNGSTIYFANVNQGIAGEPNKQGPIKEGSTQNSLPEYKGNVTELGFAEGTFLQYMVTETTDNVWSAEPTSGKTREQLAARISGQKGKYVTVQFAVSEDIASGSVFHVWGLSGATHTQNGAVNFTTKTHGRILDANGQEVSSLSKNTVYILELYIEGTDTYKVANICKTGMELYFAPDSITYSDSSMTA